jgi:hypothetical protein
VSQVTITESSAGHCLPGRVGTIYADGRPMSISSKRTFPEVSENGSHVSVYDTTQPVRRGNASTVRRPATLIAALAVTVTGAVSAIVDGLVMLLGGEALAREVMAIAVADLLGITVQEVVSEGGDDLVGLQGMNVVTTLESRGYAMVVAGGVLLLFGLLSHRAAVWARVVVTVASVPTMAVALLIALDAGTALMSTLAGAAMLGSAAAVVLVWLPATNKYARHVRIATK